jgi:hypothetical protein
MRKALTATQYADDKMTMMPKIDKKAGKVWKTNSSRMIE